MFHVSLGHNFGFSFASFSLLLFVHVFHFSSSILFCLVCVPFGSGSQFCLERNIFVCVCGPGPLVSGSRFCFGKMVWGIRSKTVRLRDPGFCLKPSISVYVRDRLALGACSLFGTNFCWFGSRSRFSFLWNEILLCLRSETVRLREPVLVI